MSMQPASLPKHYPALDGVRGLAVLAVIILHFTLLTPTTGGEWWFMAVASGGWAGVDLFFVLSGFLITGILLDSKGKPGYFRNFVARRTLRILPLYYAFLVLIFFVLPLVHGATRAHLDAVGGEVWIWAYLSNIRFAAVGWEGMPDHTTHLWSLAVEEQFYLIWPVVVLMCSRSTLARVCVALLLAGPVVRLALYGVQPLGVAGYVLLPARADALALGALLAVAARGAGGLVSLRRLARPAFIAGGIMLLATAAITAVTMPGEGLLPPMSKHVQLLGFPAVALLSASLVALAATTDPATLFSRVLRSRVLLTLGKYSYAIYILHIPLRNMLRGRIPAFPRLFGSQIPAQIGLIVVCLALSTLMAMVSWYLLERPFLDLKRYFAYDAATVPVAASVAAEVADVADVAEVAHVADVAQGPQVPDDAGVRLGVEGAAPA